MEIQNVLLTTDFSELARKAYPAAAAMTSKFGATAHLVYVAEPLSPYLYLHSMGIETYAPQGSYIDRLDRQLKDEISNNDILKGLSPTAEVLYHAYPHEVLRRYITDNKIDLVVLSTHGRSALGHMMLGSFTEKVVRYSPAPVLTFREREGDSFPYEPCNILVPFDFSENSKAVFPLLRLLGRTYDARFTFLHALEPILPIMAAPIGAGEMLPEEISQIASEAPERAQAKFNEIQEKEFPDLVVDFKLAHGSPFKEIANLAKESDADLIVMATHGWTGLDHLLIGSVAEKTVRKAPCSVLTVKPTTIKGPTDET